MNRTQRAMIRAERNLSDLDRAEKENALYNLKISTFSSQRTKYGREVKEKRKKLKNSNYTIGKIKHDMKVSAAQKNEKEMLASV